MCEYGTTIGVLVTIPENLSKTGRTYQEIKQVDKCISMIVRALHAYGFVMLSSCCGHGKDKGHIKLQDGRTLWIDRDAK